VSKETKHQKALGMRRKIRGRGGRQVGRHEGLGLAKQEGVTKLKKNWQKG